MMLLTCKSLYARTHTETPSPFPDLTLFRYFTEGYTQATVNDFLSLALVLVLCQLIHLTWKGEAFF